MRYFFDGPDEDEEEEDVEYDPMWYTYAENEPFGEMERNPFSNIPMTAYRCSQCNTEGVRKDHPACYAGRVLLSVRNGYVKQH